MVVEGETIHIFAGMKSRYPGEIFMVLRRKLCLPGFHFLRPDFFSGRMEGLFLEGTRHNEDYSPVSSSRIFDTVSFLYCRFPDLAHR